MRGYDSGMGQSLNDEILVVTFLVQLELSYVPVLYNKMNSLMVLIEDTTCMCP